MSTAQPGFWIPSDSQAKMTLRKMAHDVNGAIQEHDFVWWVRGEIQKVAPESISDRNQTGIARAIRDYVSSHIHFAPDPVGIENLTPPQEHMRLFESGMPYVLGDCDDAATLSASMGKALGIPASFKILAFFTPTNPYQHVITYLHPRGGSAIDMDTTRPAQRLPPVATRSFEMNV